jgi:hypothetical protein
MNIVRYIKFDLVGFFLLWSNRMSTPRRIFEWKSSLEVKSSNTCYRYRAHLVKRSYLVDGHEAPEKNADLLTERNHIY